MGSTVKLVLTEPLGPTTVELQVIPATVYRQRLSRSGSRGSLLRHHEIAFYSGSRLSGLNWACPGRAGFALWRPLEWSAGRRAPRCAAAGYDRPWRRSHNQALVRPVECADPVLFVIAERGVPADPSAQTQRQAFSIRSHGMNWVADPSSAGSSRPPISCETGRTVLRRTCGSGSPHAISAISDRHCPLIRTTSTVPRALDEGADGEVEETS